MKPKIGDVIIGRSPLGELVVGPVISLDEKRSLAIVGPWQQNSSAATFDSCVAPPEVKKAEVKPATPPAK